MMKKALRNTMIFSLIIANLIIWPMLFSDIGDNSRKGASVEQGNSSGAVKSETVDATTENGEEAPSNAEQTEDSSNKDNTKDAPFKILEIE
jgi:hypothetical protein